MSQQVQQDYESYWGYEAEDFEPRQVQAIILLARGYRVRQVAEQLGLAESTIYNWKTYKDFSEALRDETRAYLDDVRLHLSALATRSVDRLGDLVDSEDPNVALKAVALILKSTGNDELTPEKYSMRHCGLETPFYKEQEKKQRTRAALDAMLGDIG